MKELYVCNKAEDNTSCNSCNNKIPKSLEYINNTNRLFINPNLNFCTYRNIPVKAIPYKKEEKVEEYKVIKSFTKYDYIIQHQKKYGWTSFKDSCAEFQKDMEGWVNDKCIIDPKINNTPTMCSDNFYKHGVMFGFLEKVEPEVFYKVGDRFTNDCMETEYILAKAELNNAVIMVNLSNGNLWSGSRKVSDWDKIPKSKFEEIYPGFKKVSK
jgi:hypothetical protein